ncbi:MAG TPA: CheR family methyltransferase [Burkholderiales bacterium]|nr:CheR family methyltransferase [Burkholderiales bacterium]
MQGRDCTAFLQWALPRLERSWPGYRRVRRLVCKRLAQRLKALGLADLDAYRRHLAARPQEWREFDALCGIPVSRFYRDRGIYDALERSILPELVHAAAPRSALAAWSAGCASGEEPYTLALIWAIRLHPRFPGAGLRIVATDSNAEVLARARAGRYAASSLKELPRDLRTQGFEEQDGTWRIREPFRAVNFVQQDLREAMPEGPFDLILCRNVVLTYYSPPLRDMLMARVVDRLRPGGALVIGAHESVPPGMRELVAWPGTRSIYRRRPVERSA